MIFFRINAQDAQRYAVPPPASPGLVPGIVYGAIGIRTISLVWHHELAHHLGDRGFLFPHLTPEIGDQKQDAVLKDVQRHPAKVFIICTSICFQRASAKKPHPMCRCTLHEELRCQASKRVVFSPAPLRMSR